MRAAVSTVLRTAFTPVRCPAMRGRCRLRAQRPLPSMMIAMCRGRRAASSFANSSASLRSSPSGMCVVTAMSGEKQPIQYTESQGAGRWLCWCRKRKRAALASGPRLKNQLLGGDFPHTPTVRRNADEAAIRRHVDVRYLDHRQPGTEAREGRAGIGRAIEAKEGSYIDRVLVARIDVDTINRRPRQAVVGGEWEATDVGKGETTIT